MLLFGLAHGWGMYGISFMDSKFTYEFKTDKNFILSVTTSALTIRAFDIVDMCVPKGYRSGVRRFFRDPYMME